MGMNQFLPFGIVVVYGVCLTNGAQSHPLGNFTLNHTSILEIDSQRITQYAIVDYAEIPSFEQFNIIDADGDRIVTPKEINEHLERLIPKITANYVLQINGLSLQPESEQTRYRLSQGIVRVTCFQLLIRREFTVPSSADAFAIHFENQAYADRMGKSDVRLLWVSGYEAGRIEAIDTITGHAVKPVADRERSLLVANTRAISAQIHRTGAVDAAAQPLPFQFEAIDPYLDFNLVPVEPLHPDENGCYHIIHVKLAQDIVDGKSISALKPRALTGLPAIPDSMIGVAREESTPVTTTQALTNPDRGNQAYDPNKLGEAERKFSELIHTDTKDLSPTAFFGLIALAMIYGAAHALSPGHGKTVVAAYLVGTQGKLMKGIMQAIYLGFIVTISHVFVVLVVGLIALYFTAGALSAEVTIMLQIASGLMVISIGIPMVVRRSRTYFNAKLQAALADYNHDHNHDHDHEHDHGHDHGHDHNHDHNHDHEHKHGHSHGLFAHHHHRDAHGHGHSHEIPSDASWWDLLVLGVTGGMVPCLGAVLVFLLGVGYGKVALGVTLIVFFSIGLAGVLIAIGIAMVISKQLLDRIFNWFDARFGRKKGSARTFFQLGMPLVAAVLITFLGLAICIRALIQGGYIAINIGS